MCFIRLCFVKTAAGITSSTALGSFKSTVRLSDTARTGHWVDRWIYHWWVYYIRLHAVPGCCFQHYSGGARVPTHPPVTGSGPHSASALMVQIQFTGGERSFGGLTEFLPMVQIKLLEKNDNQWGIFRGRFGSLSWGFVKMSAARNHFYYEINSTHPLGTT